MSCVQNLKKLRPHFVNKFSPWKSKKCYEQTLEQDRDLIECFSVKRRSENSLESVKIENDIAAPNPRRVFFCEKEASQEIIPCIVSPYTLDTI